MNFHTNGVNDLECFCSGNFQDFGLFLSWHISIANNRHIWLKFNVYLWIERFPLIFYSYNIYESINCFYVVRFDVSIFSGSYFLFRPFLWLFTCLYVFEWVWFSGTLKTSIKCLELFGLLISFYCFKILYKNS